MQGDAGAGFLEVCGLGIAPSVSASPPPPEELCQSGQRSEGAGAGPAAQQDLQGATVFSWLFFVSLRSPVYVS